MRHFKDRHHLLNTKVHWESSEPAKALRQKPSLIFRIPREIHEEIHHATAPVPLLGHHAVIGTLRYYQVGSTPLETIDNLQFAIDRATRHPKTMPVERSLAELAIYAIGEQKPYIAEAFGTTRIVV